MTHYRHTQRGTLVLTVLGLGTVLSVAATATAPGGAALALGAGVAAVLVACMVLFGSLTVEVDADGVTASFGPGLVRRRIPADAVAGARRVRNPWYFGWGVRLIPGGWMFNVSGLDAVELELAGGRRFRIGTDDPDGLLRAVRRAAGAAPRPPAV